MTMTTSPVEAVARAAWTPPHHASLRRIAAMLACAKCGHKRTAEGIRKVALRHGCPTDRAGEYAVEDIAAAIAAEQWAAQAAKRFKALPFQIPRNH